MSVTLEGSFPVLCDAERAIIVTNCYILQQYPLGLLGRSARQEMPHAWHVSLMLTSPGYGIVGKVGVVVVDAHDGYVQEAPDPATVVAAVRELREAKREELHAAFLHACIGGDLAKQAPDSSEVAVTFFETLCQLPARYGFRAERAQLDLNRLAGLHEQGVYPIVPLDLFPLDGEDVYRTMVPTSVSADRVRLNDPCKGVRDVSRLGFNEAWRRFGYNAIVVRPR